MPTIYRTLLAKGYFPKELPPPFSSSQFAAYACTKEGRALLTSKRRYATACVAYDLALPGLERRSLSIPHPATFTCLTRLISQSLSRLLKKGSASPFSRSRPVYSQSRARALGPSYRPANLARERMLTRSTGTYLLRADVAQFYPSLYTHAVGWAIDQRLRRPAHFQDGSLLGKKVDRALMKLQNSESQGIPIGNDISFLLAELVLAQVDKHLAATVPGRCFRWYDDYEIACDSYEEAEEALRTLTGYLRSFRLRLNTTKTQIVRLPIPTHEDWQHELSERSPQKFSSASDIVRFFDVAFRLRSRNPHASVLLYALSVLFGVSLPSAWTARVAQSGVLQALLAEPGVAQKAVALLTFWKLNGLTLDLKSFGEVTGKMLLRSRTLGVSSDIAWALAFCLQNSVPLDESSADALSGCADDCVTLLALQAFRAGLLPRGFSQKRIAATIKGADPEGEHWLLIYEAAQHGFLPSAHKLAMANTLFAQMLSRKVAFFRTKPPEYSMIIHPGSAPEWMLSQWTRDAIAATTSAKRRRDLTTRLPALGGLVRDLAGADASHTAGPVSVTDSLKRLEDGPVPLTITDLVPYE